LPSVLPEAVLWDMDGTLIDSEKLWDISLMELATQLGGRLSAQTRAEIVGSNTDATIRIMFRSLGLEPEQEALAKAADWLTERTSDLYRDELPWRPGAREALLSLHANDVPMALVTSTERMLTEHALNTIGREFFLTTVCGDEVAGKNKPHPEPYLKAARVLGVEPSRCVAVEDSPTGMKSAVSAGCTVIVVPSEVPVAPGDGWLIRDSLVGLDAAAMAAIAAGVRLAQ
jgi:HAD superfamily hydrolase (TIGR01509 family)